MITRQLLGQFFRKVQGGAFEVVFWDGASERYGIGEPQFTLKLRDAGLQDLLNEDMEVGFGEAYMRGRIDVQGDLADVVALAIPNQSLQAGWLAQGVSKAVRQVARLARRSRRQQKDDVSRHYDLGNDFFRLWLDDSLTYSCAYFRKPTDSLEDAQTHKIDHSLRKLRLRPGDRLLDIGSGWGSVIVRAVETYPVNALGITLSDEQVRGSSAMLAERNLVDRAEVRLAHYEELAHEGQQFDRIVSIGMIEHVGRAHLAEFSDATAAMLKPDGLALLHLITTPNPASGSADTVGWVGKYIFPGGYIPGLGELIGRLTDAGLRILDVENLRPHYRMTLDHWSERYERSVPAVRERFGEEFVRMWRLYLRGASAAFRVGSLEVHQLLVSKGPTDSVPLTRDDVYA